MPDINHWPPPPLLGKRSFAINKLQVQGIILFYNYKLDIFTSISGIELEEVSSSFLHNMNILTKHLRAMRQYQQ